MSETHAAAIGYVAIQWSAVEGALAGLVGHLLKIEGPAARALTDDRSAFAILNMATVLINLSGDTQAISEWGSLSARHEALRPQRNDAVHAEWQVSGGNHIALRTRTRKKLTVRFELTATDTLNQLADDALILAEDITTFAMNTVVVRELPEKVVSLYPPGLYTPPPPARKPKPSQAPNPRPPKLSSAQKRTQKGKC